MMEEVLAFDDVLIKPQFSSVTSRRHVDISTVVAGREQKIPVISSNMTTITSTWMAKVMLEKGAQACLHRFQSIESNIDQLKQVINATRNTPLVSLGIGSVELERAQALFDAGASVFVIDVAHGAADHVVKQYKYLREMVGFNAKIIVGNFATLSTISDFNSMVDTLPDAYKIGIGSGAACSTRVVTGCGIPTLASLLDCSRNRSLELIADGGCKTSGDIAKALAAGASSVFLGSMLAGTKETEAVTSWSSDLYNYQGSASEESYKEQNKADSWRAAEGESFLVPAKGPVSQVLQQIEGGLRSAFSYVGAVNLTEFRERAKLVRVTNSGLIESGPHGKEN